MGNEQIFLNPYCNLLVKNFPPEYNEEDLQALFGEFGKIESVKILPSNRDNSLLAFVLYKQPDCATSARLQLHGKSLQGKNLYVTNYDLPESQKQQQQKQENNDKA